MFTTSVAYKAVIASGSIQTLRQAEILDADGVVVATLANIVDGAVTADFNRAHRRTGSLTIEAATTAAYETADYWADKRIKLSMKVVVGLALPAATTPRRSLTPIFEIIPLGVFDVTSFRLQEVGAGEIVDLGLTEKSFTLEARAFEASRSFAAGSGLASMIRAFACEGGETPGNIVCDTFSVGTTTTRALQYPIGDSRWKAMRELAKSLNADLYYDATGVLRLKKLNLLAGQPWTAAIAVGENLASATTEIKLGDVKNRVVVTASSASKGLVGYAVAANLDPESPTNVRAIGARTMLVKDSVIPGVGAAAERAALELDRQTTLADRIDFTAVADWSLEPGDIVRVTSRTIADTFFLESVDYAFKAGGAMRCRARRLTRV